MSVELTHKPYQQANGDLIWSCPEKTLDDDHGYIYMAETEEGKSVRAVNCHYGTVGLNCVGCDDAEIVTYADIHWSLS